MINIRQENLGRVWISSIIAAEGEGHALIAAATVFNAPEPFVHPDKDAIWLGDGWFDGSDYGSMVDFLRFFSDSWVNEYVVEFELLVHSSED